MITQLRVMSSKLFHEPNHAPNEQKYSNVVMWQQWQQMFGFWVFAQRVWKRARKEMRVRATSREAIAVWRRGREIMTMERRVPTAKRGPLEPRRQCTQLVSLDARSLALHTCSAVAVTYKILSSPVGGK